MNAFKLDKHPKIDSGFKVPEGYFDHFPEQVMQQIAQPEVKAVSLFSKRKSWLFAAAAVLVLALAIPIINKVTVKTSEPDQATLESYIAYNSDLSDDDIVNLLEKDDIEKIKIDYKLEDKAIEDELPSGSDIENYILD